MTLHTGLTDSGENRVGGQTAPVVEALAVALLAAANVALNHKSARAMAVPGSLAVSSGMLAVALAVGADPAKMGLDPARTRRGLLAGAACGLPIASMVVLGAVLPQTRHFFRDARIVGATTRQAAYELLVRIPIATAASEELTFRSAFEGMLLRRRSPAVASLSTALAFGAWHILPTIDRAHSNPGVAGTHGGSKTIQAGIVAGVVGATSIASLGLSLLQRRTGSVLAPIIVHYSINAAGYASGWLLSRSAPQPDNEPGPNASLEAVEG